MRTSRRQLLIAGGAAALLAACGGEAKRSDLTAALRITNGKLLVPGESRVAISLVDSSQTLVATGPETLTGSVVDQQGKEIVGRVTADLHAEGIPQAYWPFRFSIPAAGFYQLRIKGVSSITANFGVFDPQEVTMPHIGAVLAPFDTPTVADHRGVEPYCSLTPSACPLHDLTLTDALRTGKPVVYMIGTPAHCQTGACAPALQFLVATHGRVGEAVTMVHADVYADNAGTQFAPAVAAAGLDYEPAVYFCSPDGTIVDRLDGIWDQAEIDERVDALVTG